MCSKLNKFASKTNILVMKNLNRIKVALVERNKTGKWLAEQLGVNTATVSKWCSNTCQPNLYTLDKIATLLEITTRELLSEDYK